MKNLGSPLERPGRYARKKYFVYENDRSTRLLLFYPIPPSRRVNNGGNAANSYLEATLIVGSVRSLFKSENQTRKRASLRG